MFEDDGDEDKISLYPSSPDDVTENEPTSPSATDSTPTRSTPRRSFENTQRYKMLVTAVTAIQIKTVDKNSSIQGLRLRLQYNRDVQDAKNSEKSGDWKSAARKYIQAIKISDSDEHLHKKLFLLQHILSEEAESC